MADASSRTVKVLVIVIAVQWLVLLGTCARLAGHRKEGDQPGGPTDALEAEIADLESRLEEAERRAASEKWRADDAEQALGAKELKNQTEGAVVSIDPAKLIKDTIYRYDSELLLHPDPTGALLRKSGYYVSIEEPAVLPPGQEFRHIQAVEHKGRVWYAGFAQSARIKGWIDSAQLEASSLVSIRGL